MESNAVNSAARKIVFARMESYLVVKINK